MLHYLEFIGKNLICRYYFFSRAFVQIQRVAKEAQGILKVGSQGDYIRVTPENSLVIRLRLIMKLTGVSVLRARSTACSGD